MPRRIRIRFLRICAISSQFRLLRKVVYFSIFHISIFTLICAGSFSPNSGMFYMLDDLGLIPRITINSATLAKQLPESEMIKLYISENREKRNEVQREFTIGYDVSNRDFKYAEFVNCEMINLNLSESDCSFSFFFKSNLLGANLDNGIFTKSSFADMNLQFISANTVDFSKSNFYNIINAQNSDFSRTNFDLAFIHGDFSFSNFEYTSGDGTVFSGCNFSNSNLSNGLFQGALFQSIWFENANLESSIYLGAEFSSTTFKNTNLSIAVLDGSFFSKVIFDSTDFWQAQVEGCIFSQIKAVNILEKVDSIQKPNNSYVLLTDNYDYSYWPPSNEEMFKVISDYLSYSIQLNGPWKNNYCDPQLDDSLFKSNSILFSRLYSNVNFEYNDLFLERRLKIYSYPREMASLDALGVEGRNKMREQGIEVAPPMLMIKCPKNIEVTIVGMLSPELLHSFYYKYKTPPFGNPEIDWRHTKDTVLLDYLRKSRPDIYNKIETLLEKRILELTH